MGLNRSAWVLVALLASCSAAPEPAGPQPSSGESVVVGETTIEVDLPASAKKDVLLEWVSRAALAVEAYHGRWPVSRFRVEVSSKKGSGVSNGVAASGGRALIEIEVGAETTAAELARDWTLTHEMLHLTAPDVGRRWFEEGLAVYAEPIARLRAGQTTEKVVWKEMLETYDMGQPAKGDKGLDGTDTWARSYYGGALFFFVADVELRKATKNAKGLEHALRAIAAEGGVVGASWSVDRALEAGDRGTGTSVLRDLGKRWRGAPVRVDLPALFRELGVELRRGEVVLHEDAPLSGVRRAIVSGAP